MRMVVRVRRRRVAVILRRIRPDGMLLCNQQHAGRGSQRSRRCHLPRHRRHRFPDGLRHDHVCHHHRRRSRPHEVRSRRRVYRTVGSYRLCAARAHGLGRRWQPHRRCHRRARLRRRRRGAHQLGRHRTGALPAARQAARVRRDELPRAQRAVRGLGRNAFVVRLVRLQRRLAVRSRRRGGPRIAQHDRRLSGGHVVVDARRTYSRRQTNACWRMHRLGSRPRGHYACSGLRRAVGCYRNGLRHGTVLLLCHQLRQA